MPLARYFLFVGGVLLTLLFVVNAVQPTLPVADRPAPDLPVIRIHSDRKWPERVVFDTRLPITAPAQIAKAEAAAPAPAAVAEVSTKAQVRDAFAQLQPVDVKSLAASDSRKPVPKLPPKRKIAKKSVVPPTVQVAQQPQFGFFGTGSWNSTW
jgi:hypothetical protein